MSALSVFLENPKTFKHEQITFCVRGTNISLYESSSIFCFSKMLSAILERWWKDCLPNLDVDPQSFHFLVDYCNHIQESQENPSKINELLTKLYNEKIMSNPQYIHAAIYLEMNLESFEWLVKEDWYCHNEQMTALNACVKHKEWHYVDCFVYIAFMLKEKEEMFDDVILTIRKGIDDDYPQKTLLRCIHLEISWPCYGQIVEPGMNPSYQQIQHYQPDKLVFGMNSHGNYSVQYSSICYKPLDTIIEETKKCTNPRTREFCEKIIAYIPGYNNICKRKL